VTHDPKVEIRIADGRHELLSQQRQYDLITLEPPPPPAAGVVNLYSREFYEPLNWIIKGSLNDIGKKMFRWP